MISLKSPSIAIKKILAVSVISFILLYALFEARGLIAGPALSIDSPKNGETIYEPAVQITGNTRSITELTINGGVIAVHENGTFSNAVVLKDGYNEIVLTVKDRFNREVSETLQIMHERSPLTAPKLTQEYAEQKNN